MREPSNRNTSTLRLNFNATPLPLVGISPLTTWPPRRHVGKPGSIRYVRHVRPKRNCILQRAVRPLESEVTNLLARTRAAPASLCGSTFTQGPPLQQITRVGATA